MPDGTIELDVRLRFLQSIQKDIDALRRGVDVPLNVKFDSAKAERLVQMTFRQMQRAASRELKRVFEKEGLIPMLQSVEAVRRKVEAAALRPRSMQILTGAAQPVEYTEPHPITGEGVIPNLQVAGLDIKDLSAKAVRQLLDHVHAGAVAGIDANRSKILTGGTAAQKLQADLAALSKNVRSPDEDVLRTALGKTGFVPGKDFQLGVPTAKSKEHLSKRIKKLIKDSGGNISLDEQNAVFTAVFQQELAGAEQKFQSGLTSGDAGARQGAHEKVKQTVKAGVKKRTIGVIQDGREFDRMVDEVLAARVQAYQEIAAADSSQQQALKSFLKTRTRHHETESGYSPRGALEQAEAEVRQEAALAGVPGYGETVIREMREARARRPFNSGKRERQIGQATAGMSAQDALPIAFQTARDYPSSAPSGKLDKISQGFLRSAFFAHPSADPDVAMRDIGRQFQQIAAPDASQLKYVQQQISSFSGTARQLAVNAQAAAVRLGQSIAKQVAGLNEAFQGSPEKAVLIQLAMENAYRQISNMGQSAMRMTRAADKPLAMQAFQASLAKTPHQQGLVQQWHGVVAQQATQPPPPPAPRPAPPRAMSQNEVRFNEIERLLRGDLSLGGIKKRYEEMSGAPGRDRRQAMKELFNKRAALFAERERLAPLIPPTDSPGAPPPPPTRSRLETRQAIRKERERRYYMAKAGDAEAAKQRLALSEKRWAKEFEKTGYDQPALRSTASVPPSGQPPTKSGGLTPGREWLSKQPKGMEDAIREGIKTNIIHGFIGSFGVPEDHLGKIAAYREIAAEMGLHVGPPVAHAGSGNFTMSLTKDPTVGGPGSPSPPIPPGGPPSAPVPPSGQPPVPVLAGNLPPTPMVPPTPPVGSGGMPPIPPGGQPPAIPPVPPGGQPPLGPPPPPPPVELPWQIKQSLRTQVGRLSTSTEAQFPRDMAIALGSTGQVSRRTLQKTPFLTPRQMVEYFQETRRQVQETDPTGVFTPEINEKLKGDFSKGTASNLLQQRFRTRGASAATLNTPGELQTEIDAVSAEIVAEFAAAGESTVEVQKALVEYNETMMREAENLRNKEQQRISTRFSKSGLRQRITERIEGSNYYGSRAAAEADKILKEELAEIDKQNWDKTDSANMDLYRKTRLDAITTARRFTDPAASMDEQKAVRERQTYESAGPGRFTPIDPDSMNRALTEAAKRWQDQGDILEKNQATIERTYGVESVQARANTANASQALTQAKLLNAQKDRAVLLTIQISELENRINTLRAKGGVLANMQVANLSRQMQEKQGDLNNILNPDSTTGGHGMRQWNFGIQQLAYGVEDFFQVTSMGFGPLKGFLSAANNMGPALSLLGVHGAAASAGVAGLMAAVTVFSGVAERKKPTVDELVKSVNDLADAFERAATFRFQMDIAKTPISGQSVITEQLNVAKERLQKFTPTGSDLLRETKMLEIEQRRAAVQGGLKPWIKERPQGERKPGLPGQIPEALRGQRLFDTLNFRQFTQPSVGAVQNPMVKMWDELTGGVSREFQTRAPRTSRTPEEGLFGRPRNINQFTGEFGHTNMTGPNNRTTSTARSQEYAHFVNIERQLTEEREAFFAKDGPGAKSVARLKELSVMQADADKIRRDFEEKPLDTQGAAAAANMSRRLGRPEIILQYAAQQFETLEDAKKLQEETARTRNTVSEKKDRDIEHERNKRNELMDARDFVQAARDRKRALTPEEAKRMQRLMDKDQRFVGGNANDRTQWLAFQSRLQADMEKATGNMKVAIEENKTVRMRDEAAVAAIKAAQRNVGAAMGQGPLMAAAIVGQAAPRLDKAGLVGGMIEEGQAGETAKRIKERFDALDPASRQAAHAIHELMLSIEAFGGSLPDQVKQVMDLTRKFEQFLAMAQELPNLPKGVVQRAAQTTLVEHGKALGFDFEPFEMKQDALQERHRLARQALNNRNINKFADPALLQRMDFGLDADFERQAREAQLQRPQAQLARQFDQALPEAQQAASFIKEAQFQAAQEGLPQIEGTIAGIMRAAKEANLPISDLAMRLGMTAERARLLDEAIQGLGDAADPQIQKLRHLAAAAALREERQAIESDPVVQLMSTANEFAAAVMTVDRALKEGVELAKGSAGALTEQQGAWLGLMGALGKAGYSLHDLNTRMVTLDQNQAAMIGTIQRSTLLTADQKKQAERQVRDQTAGKRFDLLYNSVEQQAARAARGGFIDDRNYALGAGGQQISGKMLNFQDSVESLKDELARNINQVLAGPGSEEEKGRAIRSFELAHQKKVEAEISRMVGNPKGRITMNSVEGLYQSIQQSLTSDPGLAVEEEQLDVLNRMLQALLNGRPLDAEGRAMAEWMFGPAGVGQPGRGGMFSVSDPIPGAGVVRDSQGKTTQRGPSDLPDWETQRARQWDVENQPDPFSSDAAVLEVLVKEQTRAIEDLKAEFIKQFTQTRQEGIPQRMV